jgi:activating signal cointegrator complex subunit 3
MEEIREFPRLTGRLRMFAVYDSHPSSDIASQKALLQDKRTKRKVTGGSGATWPSVHSSIISNCSPRDLPQMKSDLKEFIQLTSDILGSEEQSTVDSASLFLYNLFRSPPDTWSNKVHGESIRKELGPYPATMAVQAFNIVKRISACLPTPSTSGGVEQGVELQSEFGSDIRFVYPANLLDEPVPMVTMTMDDFPSDDDEEEEDVKSKGVSRMLLNELAKSHDQHTVGHVTTLSKSHGDVGTSHKPTMFTSDWLRAQCDKCSSDLPGITLYDQIFELLISEDDIMIIEHKIIDLIGYSNLDFVQEMLTNRQLIVDTILNEPVGGDHGNKSSIKADKMEGLPRPNKGYRPGGVGSNVSIKTAEEKALEKRLRKDEKKEEKIKSKQNKNENDLDHVQKLQFQGFDPEQLKKQRERELLEASQRPLFNHPKPAGTDIANYPNVYDTLVSAEVTPAIISGKRISLPASAIKKDGPLYEEIKVPHTETPPPHISDKILIKELDENLQLVFPGTKSLNTIQSAIFDSAYYTNENLLISAPTGAGKTNVAMLTVLREINNNIDAGVIRRDQFKIIYVAPMKALAAEVVRNFGQRLAPLGVVVRELTGDMQMTKHEIQNTQMIVTTPEKWDVVTRKSTGDIALSQLVRLLIIDEIHLLHEERGSVLECLVARTLRQIESSQKLIRIVGLSATLPNYLDVARFLHVNPYKGLFYFDGRFRPVPLSQSFIGVKSRNVLNQLRDMDTVCYNRIIDNMRGGYQVMVFVHARNATVKTATSLKDMAVSKGEGHLIEPEQSPELGAAEKQVNSSTYKPLKELFTHGFGVHHAGMLRRDRNLVEKLFASGLIRVLVCTATLAWGVNLPAHSVIIKGTQIYDAKKGSFVDLGILDVLQIFGRAGRPQFDTFGEGTIITAHDKLSHYVSLLTHQLPIESQLLSSLADSVNAEISLGTVSTVEEGVQWLSYTYFYVRLHRNPLAYGVSYSQKQSDPFLTDYQKDLITSCCKNLNQAHMINVMPTSLSSTSLGRIASNFYIKYATIQTFNDLFLAHMTEADIVSMVTRAQEFEQVKVRDDELVELDDHLQNHCYLPVKGGPENTHGKINILIQTYLSQGRVDGFSLVSDLAYVIQNVGRIVRGLFEIALGKGWSKVAHKLLTLTKCLDHQLWSFDHPLKQFQNFLSYEILSKLESRDLTLERLKEMNAVDIGHMINHVRKGNDVRRLALAFPSLELTATVRPITRTVLKIYLTVTPTFEWIDRIHGNGCEVWWLWMEDPENDVIYHSDSFLLARKQVQLQETQNINFTIPIFEPLPSQYIIKVVSDKWIGAEAELPVSFKHLILPDLYLPPTKLLDLHPLPVNCLRNPLYEGIYKFKYFNPIQTQLFHSLYHHDYNILLGAPTGSGKTIVAELAMLRVFNNHPGGKCVYIAPLKALVRERMQDWMARFHKTLGKNVVELTGDTAPDVRLIDKADVIVTTPEKWDGISRSWQSRSYVQAIKLMVIDEIHLLGDERGPVLEVIVSRTNFISAHTKEKVRIIGLSTALANASDLGEWLGIDKRGLFNFSPAVRPIQLEVHIQGYPGKHYCPRMATMNKPAYSAIKLHSPHKPVLIFVSSRRQTRLTAFDLVSYVGAEDNPKQWLHMDQDMLDSCLYYVNDSNLRFVLPFGIGLHHAGLHEKDRKLVEELFVDQKIQILIATATLAWGVNLPAHLVVVKGTEYFDGKTQRYVDYPITDVLQMMGRAGRPQYDDHGVAMILVHDIKKDFYKKFLYDPFPVESNLLAVLADHLNAEIVGGTISSKQDAMDYITWTYFFRRLIMNPSYYQLEDKNKLNKYLTDIVDNTIKELVNSYCIEVEEDDYTITSNIYGQISSYYYLHHKTIKLFHENLQPNSSLEDVLKLICVSGWG